MQQKSYKIFFLYEIIACENIDVNCLCLENNTYYRHSMSYQTVLIFPISLRETFST